MNNNKIYITSDTHSEFLRFGIGYFDAPTGSVVIICGDFGGVWNESSNEKDCLDWLENKPYTFLFVDGYHENFDLLNSYNVSIWNGGKVHIIKKRK
ncbi:MAG: hypothetical protein IJL30_03275 [Clostridia bacterium]|nr:hypothetical protein [Clostridia bacterium]